MQFFVWLDDNEKTPVIEKIQAAIAAYVARFKIRPSLVLVNVVDQIEMHDLSVQSALYVQPNTFWVGHDAAADRIAP